ncbi:hypothetical protein HN011_011451 [Eciton burchellii]|nr:hypothetical protein HN011_011451 [Eciton burchellii]
MKTFVFIAFLLVMAYAADLEEVKLFYKTYMECIKELGLPTSEKLHAKGIKCVGEKENLYDKEDKIISEKLRAYFDKIFITGFIEQGNEIMLNCIEEGYQGSGNNYEKSIAFIECCLKNNIQDFITTLK